jgi:hypothetical protein
VTTWLLLAQVNFANSSRQFLSRRLFQNGFPILVREDPISRPFVVCLTHFPGQLPHCSAFANDHKILDNSVLGEYLVPDWTGGKQDNFAFPDKLTTSDLCFSSLDLSSDVSVYCVFVLLCLESSVFVLIVLCFDVNFYMLVFLMVMRTFYYVFIFLCLNVGVCCVFVLLYDFL